MCIRDSLNIDFETQNSNGIYDYTSCPMYYASKLYENNKRVISIDISNKDVYKRQVLVLISCLCNAVSELLDKMLMQSMNSGQLQFWYMFFMVILYLGYMIAVSYTHLFSLL